MQALEASRRQFLVSMAACLLTPALAGCQRRPIPPAAPPSPTLHSTPLTSLVPSAGLQWLLLAKPRELLAIPALAEPISTLLPPARLDALARMTGVDPRTLTEVVIGSFGDSMLWLGAGSFDSSLIAERFRARLVGGAEQRSLHPHLVRLSGQVGSIRRTLVLVGEDTVAMAIGNPKLASAVEAYALGRLSIPPALEAQPLAELPSEITDSPVSIVAAGPFEDGRSRGARGLLRAAMAAGCSARVLPDARILAKATIVGAFSEEDDGIEERLLAAWTDLAQSPLGHLTALDRPLAGPRASRNADKLSIEAEFDGRSMLLGLADFITMRFLRESMP